MVREDDEKLETLISEVEKNPGLYNKELEIYKDATKKEDIWKAIGGRLGYEYCIVINTTDALGVNISIHNDQTTTWSPTLFNVARILSIYVQPVLCVLGLAGNILSLMIFLSKDLRKVSSNIYLSALSASCSVFLLAVLISWLEIFNFRLFHQHVWCQSIVFLTYVSSFLTVWFVVCITIENYIVTFHLRKATYCCTVTKAKIVILCLVLLAFVMYAFSLWTSVVEVHNGQNMCTSAREYSHIASIFTYVDALVTLILPSVVLVVLIAAILIKHFYQKHRRTRHSPNCLHSCNGRLMRLSKKEKSLLKITRVLLAIGLSYVVLSLPSYIYKVRFLIAQSIHRSLVGFDEQSWNQICQVIFYAMFTLNCLFYIKWSLNFRRGLQRLFRVSCKHSDKQKQQEQEQQQQQMLALTHGQASVNTERTNAPRPTGTSV